MARRKRYHLPGGTFHVMLRGNAGEQIFFCDEDRCRMCLLIQEGVERYGHRVIAYCFMSNHLHLAIQIGQFPLSQISPDERTWKMYLICMKHINSTTFIILKITS